MLHFSSFCAGGTGWGWPLRCWLLLVVLAWLPWLSYAQAPAPAWQLALSGNNNQPGTGANSSIRASVVDADGNVFITGSFSGSITFGTTRLTSVVGTSPFSNADLFVAKWDATAQAFTWATSGGGTGNDIGLGLAVSGNSVYVTGLFASGSNASIAGRVLAGAGSDDLFVAKYYDTSTGNTPATSSFANGWAISGGSPGADTGTGLAVNGRGVFVTGSFTTSNGVASIAGQTLTGMGSTDMFVAKYLDTSTGNTPATSSVANGWATSGGGIRFDYGYGIAVSGSSVYVTGAFDSGSFASIGGQAVTGVGDKDVFVAKYTDTSTPTTSSYTNGWVATDGSAGYDVGCAIAVRGTGIYITGSFASGRNASIAGQVLAGAGSDDVFIAKYNDTSTSTTSSFAGGWAVSGGGSGSDTGYGLAVSGPSVYVTGSFTSSGMASIAGQVLAGSGLTEAFVAKYLDTSTGNTPAASSVVGSWGTSGGGTSYDTGYSIAASDAGVFVAGEVGTDGGSFGAPPNRLYAPGSSGVLGLLAPTTGTWQRADGPLQGGTSLASASAADASGNVFVTGSFTGSVGFGTTRLVSAGSEDLFVAKWDATTQAFTWATSGGGTGAERGNGLAISGKNLYVTGYFTSSSGTSIAGQALNGAGLTDLFVAKYSDTSAGHMPASSSFANGWAVSGGSAGSDVGQAIAVSGTGVYVTGYFASGNSTTIAGQILPLGGVTDVFVAKYYDTSTGNTPATSSFANGWAISGGGAGFDAGYGIAVSGTGVYVTGTFDSTYASSFAGRSLTGAGSQDMFVAKYLDTSTGNTPATSSVAGGWATSGGGGGYDSSAGIAVSGTGVYVTGYFTTGSNAHVAGQALAGVGGPDMFVAKYVDTSTGNTPATSSFANGWVTSGGSTSDDFGQAIAVSGTSVYVTGYFTSSAVARFAGQALGGAGYFDTFVAKYVDTSTPATSSFANGWATSGGGTGADIGYSVAVSGQQLYITGSVIPPATFGSISLSNSASGAVNFLSRLTDTALTPLPLQAATPAETALSLYPNPVLGGVAILRGSVPGTHVQVLDALGRVVTTATTTTSGTAQLALPNGLASGVYIVRSGTAVLRLTIE